MRLAPCAVAATLLISSLAADEVPRAKFGTTVVVSSGLRGRVYHIRHWTKELPDFSKMRPKGTIYTTSLNVPVQDFHQGFPGVTKRFEWFAIDYTGRFWIAQPALYRFQLTSDDGAKLYIDGEVIADNDGEHPVSTIDASVHLSAGIHSIRVSYFQGPRFQVALVLEIAPPGRDFEIFDMNQFKPPPDLEQWPEPDSAQR